MPLQPRHHDVKGLYCRRLRTSHLQMLHPEQLTVNRDAPGVDPHLEMHAAEVEQRVEDGEDYSTEDEEERHCFFACFGFAKEQPSFPSGTVVTYTDSKGRRKAAEVEGMVGAQRNGKPEYAMFIGFRSPGVSPDDMQHILGPCTCFNTDEMESAPDAAAFMLRLHNSSIYGRLWGDQDQRLVALAGGKDAAGNAMLDKFMDTVWKSRVWRVKQASKVAERHFHSGKDSKHIARCGLELRRAGFSKKFNRSLMEAAVRPEKKAARVHDATAKFLRAMRSSLLMHPTGADCLTRLYEDYMRMECGINVQRICVE